MKKNKCTCNNCGTEHFKKKLVCAMCRGRSRQYSTEDPYPIVGKMSGIGGSQAKFLCQQCFDVVWSSCKHRRHIINKRRGYGKV